MSDQNNAIVGIVERALAPLKRWSESRFCGTRSEKLIWLGYHDAAPAAIIEALYEAGFAIVEAGGALPTEVRVEDTEHGYRRRFRSQMEMPRLIAFAEETVGQPMASDPEFVEQHLPRLLAKVMLRQFEPQVSKALHFALCAATAPQKKEADNAAEREKSA